jgi:acetyl esterase/lipase
MASIRAKIVAQVITRGGLLNTVIGANNLKEKRRQFKKLERRFPAPRWAKITPVHTSSFNGELVVAPNSRQSKALLYLHGGGFVFDATKLYRDLIARLAKATELSTLSVDYSLAPEHPYPTALNEVLAAYQWLLEQGYKPENIALGGDSAGGTLALSLLHKLRDQKIPMPACVFVMSPATDATFENTSVENSSKDIYISLASLRFFTESYLGGTAANDPVASPLLGPLDGFPPLLMHVDKNEIMYNDTAQFVTKAREAGVDVELHESNDLFHVWHIFARYMPEAKQSIDDIGRFVKKHIS